MNIFAETSVHGDDVFWPEELYYYLDATPTHSYMKMMYKYPQASPAAQQCHFERVIRAMRAWPSMAQHPGRLSFHTTSWEGSTLKERRTLCFWISPASQTPQVNHSKSPWQSPQDHPGYHPWPLSQGVWVAGHRDFRWQSILWRRDRAPALAWTRRRERRAEHGKTWAPFLQVCPGRSGWYSRSFLSDIKLLVYLVTGLNMDDLHCDNLSLYWFTFNNFQHLSITTNSTG